MNENVKITNSVRYQRPSQNGTGVFGAVHLTSYIINPTSSAGFTLIEFLVAMGIMGMLFSLGLFFSMDSYRAYSFRSERNLAVTVLQKARSMAVSNVNEKPHGVHVDSVNKKYIIFEDTTFTAGASSNIDIPFVSSSVSHSGMSDVLFNQLDGSVTTPPSAWHFSDASHVSDISENSEGQISWTN